MCRRLLSILKRATIGKTRGDPDRAKRVIVDRRVNTDSDRAPANHAPRVRLLRGLLGQFDTPVPAQCAEQEVFAILWNARRADIGV